jgi:hypothetical protein
MKWSVLLFLLGCLGCITIKFQPLPVVLSWGGITTDKVTAPDGGHETRLTAPMQCQCPVQVVK